MLMCQTSFIKLLLYTCITRLNEPVLNNKRSLKRSLKLNVPWDIECGDDL